MFIDLVADLGFAAGSNYLALDKPALKPSTGLPGNEPLPDASGVAAKLVRAVLNASVDVHISVNAHAGEAIRKSIGKNPCASFCRASA
ncbi:MAG: hypothetical protein ABIW82_17835 [Dokdonella sp.]